jgi:hypothetical protein
MTPIKIKCKFKTKKYIINKNHLKLKTGTINHFNMKNIRIAFNVAKKLKYLNK